MTIEQQHYDFKMKLNKIDSQQYRNLIIPQIDWLLNEAQELFVKMIYNPRIAKQYDYSLGKKTFKDIKDLIENDFEIVPISNIVALPTNYWIYVSSYCRILKNGCEQDSLKTFIREHNEDYENSYFDASSFTWKTVNGVFHKDGLQLYTKGFKVTKCYLSYIRKLKYIHNAKDFGGGSYTLPGDSVPLVGSVNCELPDSAKEIVDIAVLLATGQLQIPDYQIKKDKLTLNQII